MAQRIKGSDTEIMVVANGQPQASINAVRNTEIVVNTELLQEEYLGESTDRFDEILKGCKGHVELHLDNPDVFNLQKMITDRAARRTPGVKINMKTTLNFPNGQRKRILAQDLYFGPMPLGVPARSQYATFRLEFGFSGPPKYL